jgi:hypothetical protein
MLRFGGTKVEGSASFLVGPILVCILGEVSSMKENRRSHPPAVYRIAPQGVSDSLALEKPSFEYFGDVSNAGMVAARGLVL